MSETQVNPTSNSQTSSPNPAPTPTVSPTSDSTNQPSPTAPTPVVAPTSSPEPSPEPTPVAPAAAPTPTVAPTPEASSTPEVMPGAGASVTNDPVQFNSSNIGIQTVKKHDPFAEQNRVAAEKKQTAKKRNRIIIIVASVVVLLAIATVTIILVTSSKPNASDTTSNTTPKTEPIATADTSLTMKDLQAQAQAKYGSEHNLNAVEKFFADQKAVTSPDYINQFYLGQITFYIMNGLSQQAVQIESQIDADQLSLEQQGIFYDAMYSLYLSLNDNEKAGKYFALSFENQLEQRGVAEEP